MYDLFSPNLEIRNSETLINQERRELKNKSNLLKQELEWLSKGVKARRKRNERRRENISILEKKFKKENSDFLKSIASIKFNQIDTPELGPNVIAQFFRVSKNFEIEGSKLKLINNFSYKLTRGEKIGIIGKNGIGKSTLLKLLIKKMKPDQGVVKIRDSIEYSYFDQKSEKINDLLSIKENLVPNGGDYIDVNGVKRHICGYLKHFLFDPSSVNDKVSILSGGQKNRLLLAKILANPKQLLILDEPTNDLDLETLDMLQAFLEKYQGTVLIASHDRNFLDNVAEKIFFFKGYGEIEVSVKSCSDLLKNAKEKKVESKERLKNYTNYKKPISLEKKIKQIMKKIEKIEETIRIHSQKLDNTKLYYSDKEKFDRITNEIKIYQNELLLLEKEWVELEERNINCKI